MAIQIHLVHDHGHFVQKISNIETTIHVPNNYSVRRAVIKDKKRMLEMFMRLMRIQCENYLYEESIIGQCMICPK